MNLRNTAITTAVGLLVAKLLEEMLAIESLAESVAQWLWATVGSPPWL